MQDPIDICFTCSGDGMHNDFLTGPVGSSTILLLLTSECMVPMGSADTGTGVECLVKGQ